jgi:hypothetical protein
MHLCQSRWCAVHYSKLVVVANAYLRLLDVLVGKYTKPSVELEPYGMSLFALFVRFRFEFVATRELQPPQTVVTENDHFAVARIGQHVELVDSVTKIPRQEYPNGNAVCDQHVVSTLVHVKRSPQRI